MKNYRRFSFILIFSIIVSLSQVAYAKQIELFDYIDGTKLEFDKHEVTIHHQQQKSQYYIIEIEDSKGNEIKKEQFGKFDAFSKTYSLSQDGDYRVILYSADDQYVTHHSLWRADLVVKDGMPDYRYFGEVYALNEKYNSNNYKYQIERLGIINQDIYDLTQSLIEDKDTILEKTIALHDWIADNIYYDYDAYYSDINIDEAYRGIDTFYNKRGVCSGIAELYYIMLKSADIPVKFVNGFAFESEEYTTYDDLLNRVKNTNHAWNEVYIVELNRWVTIDVTWDTQNRYENGKYEKKSRNYEYFDSPSKLFAQTHLVNEARIFEENRFYNNWIHLYINHDRFKTQNGYISIDKNGTTPIIIDGHTMLPIRAIIEEMGGNVTWDANTQTVTIVINNYTVDLKIGQTKFIVNYNGQVSNKNFAHSPTIINGRTMIPVRELLESIGCFIKWNPEPANWHDGCVEIFYN